MRTWRTIEVYKDKGLTASTSGKDTYALPRTHMIGSLWLAIRATTSAADHWVTDNRIRSVDLEIDSLTVRSGSKTFKQYSGEMCRKISAYNTGRLPPQYFNLTLSTENESVFPIDFGLEPQDEDVILPAPLMDSLDLVIEHSFGTGTEEWASTGAEFDLYASVLEPTADLEEKKILIQEKKRDFTTTATSGDEPFDLTLDERRLLRRIYVSAYKQDSVEGGVVSYLKLKADNEEVLAQKWINLQHQNAMDARLQYKSKVYLTDVAAGEVLITGVPNMELTAMPGATTAFELDSVTGDGAVIGAATEADSTHLFIMSDVLPAVAVIDFDRDRSLRRLQPQGIRDLDLIITQAVASGTVKVYEESLQRMW